MKNKINLYDIFMVAGPSIIENYMNIETLEIIDDYDYFKLHNEEKNKYILLPKVNRLDFLNSYFNKNPELKKHPLFNGKIGSIAVAHNILNSYGYREFVKNGDTYSLGKLKDDKWDDFLDFENEETINMIKRWCEKHHFNYYYYYEDPYYDSDEYRRKIDEKLKDLERSKYYNLKQEKLSNKQNFT